MDIINKKRADNLRVNRIRKMSEEHRIAAMRYLACDMTDQEACNELEREYGMKISQQWLGKLKNMPKYFKFFKAFQDDYIKSWKNEAKIHLSARVNRLKEADNIASGINRIITKIQEKLDAEGMFGGSEKKGSFKGESNKVDTYVMQLTRQLKSLAESYIEILKYCKDEVKRDKKDQPSQPSFLTLINNRQVREEKPKSVEAEIIKDAETQKPEIQEHASSGSVSENI